LMMNPFSWLQMTNMISYQGLVRTFPRLPSKLRKRKPSKSDIVNWMLTDASIIELMLAIGQAGFFIGEALLVVQSKDSDYVVIEGNRRLTSVILLNEPELGKVLTSHLAQKHTILNY
ncbi:hypothetical protein, partial [Aeromonas veronii]|uniref:hypothetical protein n=1 Tax=Aeromonas veronii TaxID=654 RepID=UPI003D1F6344